MHRFLIPLIPLIALFAASPTFAQTPEPAPMIELHARCIDDAQCRFLGDDVRVELELRNSGRNNVSLPVAFLRKRGPAVRLVDRHSGKEKQLRRNPVDGLMLKDLETLAPGQSVRFTWPITPKEITDFALRPIDLDAVFGLNITPERKGADATIIRARLHIVDGRVGEGAR